MTDAQTLRAYAENAKDYAQKFDTQKPSKHLLSFMEGLPSKAKVLDFGCGTGNAAIKMREAGFVVTGLDASEEMLKIAAKNASGIEWIHGCFDDLNAVKTYEGVWANFSLLHSERTALTDHIAAISKALKIGGYFHIGMKTGTGEGRDRLGRKYTYWQQAELVRILDDNGFNNHKISTGSEAGLAGVAEPWIIILSRKAA